MANSPVSRYSESAQGGWRADSPACSIRSTALGLAGNEIAVRDGRVLYMFRHYETEVEGLSTC